MNNVLRLPEKLILREGEGEFPPRGARVYVHYEVKCTSSSNILDSSYTRNEELSFRTGKGKIFPEIEETILQMKQGEKSQIVFRPEYLSTFDGIPREVTILEATIELLRWDDDCQDKKLSEMSLSERLASAEKRRLQGNEYYKQGKYVKAANEYRGVSHLLRFTYPEDFTEDEAARREAALLSSYLNLAQCCLKLNEFSAAVESGTHALEIEPNNVKALFRRGHALFLRGEYENAKTDLKRALDLCPTDTNIKKSYQDLLLKEKEYRQKEKRRFAGMFE